MLQQLQDVLLLELVRLVAELAAHLNLALRAHDVTDLVRNGAGATKSDKPDVGDVIQVPFAVAKVTKAKWACSASARASSTSLPLSVHPDPPQVTHSNSPRLPPAMPPPSSSAP